MNRRFPTTAAIGTLAALLLTVPAFAAPLNVGAKAPDFTLPATLAGKDFSFSLQKALAKGPVVLYFFPAAYTQGCDIEAHTFSTHSAQFAKAGASIIGVSENSIATLNKFEVDPNFCAGKFPIASDPNGNVGAKYGVPRIPPQKGVKTIHGKTITHGFFARTTFVINRDGKVVAMFSTRLDHIKPAQHVTKSLAIVRKMKTRNSSAL
ncbi:MAG: peroxiredoxin [Gammaproteobacteria bacterium]